MPGYGPSSGLASRRGVGSGLLTCGCVRLWALIYKGCSLN